MNVNTSQNCNQKQKQSNLRKHAFIGSFITEKKSNGQPGIEPWSTQQQQPEQQ